MRSGCEDPSLKALRQEIQPGRRAEPRGQEGDSSGGGPMGFTRWEGEGGATQTGGRHAVGAWTWKGIAQAD